MNSLRDYRRLCRLLLLFVCGFVVQSHAMRAHDHFYPPRSLQEIVVDALQGIQKSFAESSSAEPSTLVLDDLDLLLQDALSRDNSLPFNAVHRGLKEELQSMLDRVNSMIESLETKKSIKNDNKNMPIYNYWMRLRDQLIQLDEMI